MLWYVMSIDCLVVFDHEGRHPLDSVILHLLHLASKGRSLTGIDHGHNSTTSNTNNSLSSTNIPDNHHNSFQSSLSEGTPLSKKFQTFIRCSVKLLISSGNKHKIFLDSHSKLLHDILVQMVSNIEEELFYYEDINHRTEDQLQAETKFFTIEILRLLNANAKSILPSTAVQCILEWLGCFKTDLENNEHQHLKQNANVRKRLLKSMLENVANCVNSVPDMANLLETLIEAYFNCSTSKCLQGNNDIKQNETKWTNMISMVKFPSRQEKSTQLLEQCVSQGHVLLLYAYVKQRRCDPSYCKSIKDEEVLISSLLDWMRHLKLSPRSEPKLCLLYHECLYLCRRQITCGASPVSTCKHVIDLVDILIGYLGDGISTSTGSSNVAWNILGAIGLTQTTYSPSPRFKFLATSLAFFLLQQIIIEKKETVDSDDQNPDNGVPFLRISTTPVLDKQCNADQDSSNSIPCETTPFSPDKIESLTQLLTNMKKDQAYLGIVESLDWVVEKSTDHSNTFYDAGNFVQFIVANNLYTEEYCSLDNN